MYRSPTMDLMFYSWTLFCVGTPKIKSVRKLLNFADYGLEPPSMSRFFPYQRLKIDPLYSKQHRSSLIK